MEGISFIISTRWASEILEIQLNTIRDQCKTHPYELKIICDMPSWQTLKLLQDRGLMHGRDYYIVRHGHLDQNLDWGVSKANYDYICLMPDDFILGKNFDRIMMEYMENSKNRIVTPSFYIGNMSSDNPMYRCYGYPKWKYCINNPVKGEGFDYEKFYNEPVPDTTYAIGYCRSSPLQLMHKDVYKKVHGLTFCSPHAQGHEIEMMARAWGKYHVELIIAIEAVTFHFGTIGNTDQQLSTYELSKGMFKCTMCGHLDFSNGDSEHFGTERGKIILKTGLYLCERCQVDGWRIDVNQAKLYKEV